MNTNNSGNTRKEELVEEASESFYKMVGDGAKKNEGTTGCGSATAAALEPSRRAALQIAQEGLPSEINYPVVFSHERDLLKTL